MSSALFNIVSLSLAMTLVIAQSTFPPTPLASKHFSYPSGIPEKVDTDQGLVRGEQAGYNICNSTTENQNSMCQTSIFNGLDDFCLWAPPKPGQTVGEAEGVMVAWCSKPGHGTRLIPDSALTGLQLLVSPSGLTLNGFLSNQSLINMAEGDYGGEMDPHGADLRGNPMGGIMFSNFFNGTYTQIIEWTNFLGSNSFCLKACNPNGPHPAEYCQHIYDRIGCAYNAPNAAQDKVFEKCDAEDSDLPGVYTSNGAVLTYTQPPESLGPITSIPYTARVPSSSNCQTFSSAALFTSLPTVSGTTTSTSSSSSGASSRPTGQSGTAASSTPSSTSDATALTFSVFSVIFFAFAVLFLS